MVTKYVNRGPKRQIERIWSEVYEQITNASSAVVLHTADNSETMVRLKGRISFMHSDAADESVAAVIHIRPKAQGIVNVAQFAEDLDNPTPAEELIRFTQQSKLDGDLVAWDFDSKAMRKLKSGDQIVITFLGGAVDSWFAAGPVYMWFKE